MNINLSLAMQRAYNKCPDCKNEYIGNGQGTMMIDDNIFKRTCKCGYSVTITIVEKRKGKK